MIVFWITTYLLIGYTIAFIFAYYNGFFQKYDNMFFILAVNTAVWPVHVLFFIFGVFKVIINYVKNR